MKNKRCVNIALAMQQAACLGEKQGTEKKAKGQQAGFMGRVGWDLQHHHTVFAKPFYF